jgi:hypothetical protein
MSGYFLSSTENFGPCMIRHMVGLGLVFLDGLGRVYRVGRPMMRSEKKTVNTLELNLVLFGKLQLHNVLLSRGHSAAIC